MKAKEGSRALAARLLVPVIKGERSLSLESAQVNKDKDTRAFIQTLCFGVLRDFFRLQAMAEQLLAKPLRAKDTDIYALILLGLYQLDALRIPDHAAIAETAEACKQLRKLWAVKLVNAVLRNFRRNDSAIIQAALTNESAVHNHPPWLLGVIQESYPNDWGDIVDANNKQPPICLRANAKFGDRQRLAQDLALVETQMLAYAPQGLRLLSSAVVHELPGFAEGRLSVQDEAAQLAAPLLQLQPAMRVLDACSAPGGKASHIAELCASASLTCVELEQSRLDRVKENFARLRLNATFMCADALQKDAWWDGQVFDAILLDAPCSGTGVIRRHPDIKLLRRDSDIAKLAQLQLDLLLSLWPALAPGGVMLYATCSILPDENSHVVSAFLRVTEDAEHDRIDAQWGVEKELGRQLLPQVGGHDGFYYCRLMKKA